MVKSEGATLRKVSVSSKETKEYLSLIGLEKNEVTASNKLKNLELNESEIFDTVMDVLSDAGISKPKLPENILEKVRVSYIQKDMLEKLLSSIT